MSDDITMNRVETIVGSRHGLHARPAARVVEFCRGLDHAVTIGREGGPQINPKSLAMLLALDADFGESLVVESADPETAARLAELIAGELDRDEGVEGSDS
ncbi:MAG: HPr family phosphocarrier protein [Protaetiibacter sp.]